ncbi:MAG: LysE/ArgO family amino acid transporter [Bacillota bacterium]
MSPVTAALTGPFVAGTPFLAGMLLGLGMILPIGPQNVFVLTQGLMGGMRRGLLAAATAGVCDTVLILTGAAGLSALLLALPWLKTALLALGAAFLVYLGVASLRGDDGPSVSSPGVSSPGVSGPSVSGSSVSGPSVGDGATGANVSGSGASADPALPLAAAADEHRSTLSLVLTGVGVSWGNPHAILDTVAVLGSAIAARDAASRLPFAAGTVAASWIFFLLLALAGSFFRSRTAAGTQVWVRRVSGLIMLVFAVVLGREAILDLLR